MQFQFLRRVITVALLLSSAAGSAHAEDTFALNRPTLPPSSAENRIIKWCAESGTHTRYASANIQLKGYAPCGEVKTAVRTCDAVGNRMISPGGEVPYGYRDCSLGKRLVVIRHDPLDPPNDDRGLSSAEQHALNREFKQIQKDQEKQEAKDIEAAMRGFAGIFFDPNALKQQSGFHQNRAARRNKGSRSIDITQLIRALSQP